MKRSLSISLSIISILLATAVGCLGDVGFQKEPYVILTGDYSRVIVQWKLEEVAECSITWGQSSRHTQGILSVAPGERRVYSAELNGLSRDTMYSYRVAANDEIREGRFVTSPAASSVAELTFFGIGDPQYAIADHHYFPNICAAMYQDMSEAPLRRTFCLVAGDWVDYSAWGIVRCTGSESDRMRTRAMAGPVGPFEECWDAFFQKARPILAELPLIGCIGNHDVISDDSIALYDLYWPYPYVAGHYWSMDWGPVHFIFVDDYTPYRSGSSQYTWLERDLRVAATRPWTIVVKHQPDRPDQDCLFTLFREYGVDLVVCGHWHCDGLVDGTGNDELFAYRGVPELVMSASARDDYGHHDSIIPLYYRFDILGSRITVRGFDRTGTEVVIHTVIADQG